MTKMRANHCKRGFQGTEKSGYGWIIYEDTNDQNHDEENDSEPDAKICNKGQEVTRRMVDNCKEKEAI